MRKRARVDGCCPGPNAWTAAWLAYRAPMMAPCRSSRRSLSSRIDCAHPSIHDARCGPYATGRRSQVTSRVACYVLQVACCMLRINGAIPAMCRVARNAHRTPWFMASEDDVTPAMRQAERHVASQEGGFADRRCEAPRRRSQPTTHARVRM
jgi:hypothetical protein